MKKILIGIIIGIALSTSIAYAGIRYIQVPEYIRNYKTLDLLNYMADLKDKEVKLETPKEVEIKKPEPIKESIKEPVKTKGIRFGNGQSSA